MKILPLMLFLAFSVSDVASDTTPARETDLVAKETYVQLYPADGYLLVREYALGTTKIDATDIRSQAVDIAELVRSANYCKSRFGLNGFTALEERVFHDRGFITVECNLLAKERNLKKLMHSVYESVIGRPVDIAISSAEVGLHFSGQDIEIRSSNSLGVFASNEKRAVFWRNGERFYEAVFAGVGTRQETWGSLEPYFGPDVASPKLTKSQIDAWQGSR